MISDFKLKQSTDLTDFQFWDLYYIIDSLIEKNTDIYKYSLIRRNFDVSIACANKIKEDQRVRDVGTEMTVQEARKRKDQEKMREENLPRRENPNINLETGKSNYPSFICQRQFV